jgi:hypothetical protein
MFRKMLQKIGKLPTALAVALVFMLSYVGVAHAADAAEQATGEESLLELAKPVLDALRAGQYPLGAVLALVFAVALARKYGHKLPYVGGKVGPFLKTDHGGALLTLLGSFGGAFATALAAGAAPSLALAWTALGVAVAAAGGYSLIKKLGGPLVNKAPEWMRPLLRLVLFFFDHKSDQALAEAKQAGADAVKAKPSTGTAGVIGEPRDL